MYILAIDTASSAAGVAVADEIGVIASFDLNVAKTHSQRFLPMVDGLLKVLEMKLRDMSAVAVTVGPGSFTGLRIGIATAKAWGQSLGIPLVPVTTLEALALASGNGGLVCPVLDARRDEVYTALFMEREQISPPEAIQPQALAQRLSRMNAPVMVNGDAALIYQNLFREYLGENLLLTTDQRQVFMASATAVIGAERFMRGELTDYLSLRPFYLRTSAAETAKGAAAIGGKND